VTYRPIPEKPVPTFLKRGLNILPPSPEALTGATTNVAMIALIVLFIAAMWAGVRNALAVGAMGVALTIGLFWTAS
jgi:hypothetical protein